MNAFDNVRAPLELSKRVFPIMSERGGGSIINVSSIGGISPEPMLGLYSVSKTALLGLTKVLAAEWGPAKIRVNAICPGLIETGMTERVFVYARENDKMDKVGRLNPLRRAGQPSEIANMALFLASDEASYVNGQAIAVDGGLSSSHPVTRQETGKPAV